jgi:hypothetical protein
MEYPLPAQGAQSKESLAQNRRESSPFNTPDKLDAYVLPSFSLISFAYMFPWTAIGALVSYFTDTYGRSYFVIINVIFYFAGFPMSLVQLFFDAGYDSVYSSLLAFRFRIIGSMALLFATACFAPFTDRYTFAIVCFVLAIATWSCHGSVSTLAALVQYNSSTYQQIGFNLPVVASLILTLSIDTSGMGVKTAIFFFGVPAMCLLPATAAVIYLTRDTYVAKRLSLKDVHDMDLDRASSSERGLLISSDNGGCNEVDGPLVNVFQEYMASFDGCSSPPVGFPGIAAESKEFSVPLLVGGDSDSSHAVVRVPMPSVLVPELYPHARTLAAVIFASILQGAFLSYVPSESGKDLSTGLYFIRMFADLAGRPLSLFAKPEMLKSISGLESVSYVRLSTLFFFFLYIFLPPREFFRSDVVLCGYQFCLSFSSGFIVCLVYEQAAVLFVDEAKRTAGTRFLNLTFQAACFSAVVVASVIVFVFE